MNVSSIEFDVRSDEKQNISWVTPVVDGRSLVALVGDHERAQGHKLPGKYDGLVPESFEFGDLSEYCRGCGVDQWPEPRRIWLIDCECGQAGCWPLEASVVASDERVTWSDIGQPHRPEWSYESFGPFVFDRAEYEAAVAGLVRRLARDGRRP